MDDIEIMAKIVVIKYHSVAVQIYISENQPSRNQD